MISAHDMDAMRDGEAGAPLFSEDEFDEIIQAGWARYQKHMHRGGATGQTITKWDNPEAHVLEEAITRFRDAHEAAMREAVEAERARIKALEAENKRLREALREIEVDGYSGPWARDIARTALTAPQPPSDAQDAPSGTPPTRDSEGGA